VEQEGEEGKGEGKVFNSAPSDHGFQCGVDRHGKAGSVVEGFFKVM
jgi:hypothetical protein